MSDAPIDNAKASGDLAEKVAAALWRVYVASPIATVGAKSVGTWARLTELASINPYHNAAHDIREVGLAEARAAIEVVRQHDRTEIERLRADACRYVWLREHGHIAFLKRGDEVDRMVDAEMAKPPMEFFI